MSKNTNEKAEVKVQAVILLLRCSKDVTLNHKTVIFKSRNCLFTLLKLNWIQHTQKWEAIQNKTY